MRSMQTQYILPGARTGTFYPEPEPEPVHFMISPGAEARTGTLHILGSWSPSQVQFSLQPSVSDWKLQAQPPELLVCYALNWSFLKSLRFLIFDGLASSHPNSRTGLDWFFRAL